MSGDEKPVTASELMKCLEGFKTSMADELKKSVQETVHKEINLAVGPISVKQDEIIGDLSATKHLVSEIQTDHSKTKAAVAELKQQFDEMKKLSREIPAPASSLLFPPLAQIAPQQSYPPSSSSEPSDQTDPAYTSALKVLQGAKQILGFSPIKAEDISHLKDKNLVDEQEAMKMAIVEFLVYEMKVPTSITDNIVLTKVFPPAKQPSGWSTLYAEFADSSESNLVNQYATNLLPGRSLSIYVPHSLWPRFQVFNNIAHGYRNGPVKHKTKIKYGLTDFVLLVKPKDQNTPWTYPRLDLPPLRLSAYDGNPSSSPPPGRPRLQSKRARSVSPESDINRSNKTRIEKSPPSGSSEMTIHPPCLSNDPGAFHPSACASPKASFNKNFTFGAGASQIPRMNHLN